MVSASQSLTSSLTVEVGYNGVDALSGSYTMSLPVAAPKSAAFVSASVPLVFTANTAAAGQYTLTATLASGQHLSSPANLLTGNVTQNFAF